jgi:CBS domain-containing protein
VSFVLGLVFIGLAFLVPGSTPVSGTLFWLGYINIFLLVFNLLPALPLDGGRLFRAALWKLRGDLAWATRVAAGFGRVFGFLMIAGGVFLFVTQSSVSGLWLGLIGWFLLGAAGGERRMIQAREALAGLFVRDVMTRDPVTAPADATLGEFLDGLGGQRRHSAYPVVSNGDVLGLLPLKSIESYPRSEWSGRLVRNSMLPDEHVLRLDADVPAVDALDELVGSEIHRGLVFRDGALVGFLSLSDLARVLGQRPAFRR